jgi:hypothetical protein
MPYGTFNGTPTRADGARRCSVRHPRVPSRPRPRSLVDEGAGRSRPFGSNSSVTVDCRAGRPFDYDGETSVVRALPGLGMPTADTTRRRPRRPRRRGSLRRGRRAAALAGSAVWVKAGVPTFSAMSLSQASSLPKLMIVGGPDPPNLVPATTSIPRISSCRAVVPVRRGETSGVERRPETDCRSCCRQAFALAPWYDAH